MPAPLSHGGGSRPVSDDDLRADLAALAVEGSIRKAAEARGMPPGTFQGRLDMARRRGIETETPHEWTYQRMASLSVADGCVLVGSDLHCWPNVAAPMFEAFCELAHRLQPQAIVMNGDVLDGARVSRHPHRRGQNAPKLREEIEAAKRLLGMLPYRARKFWPLGNHDERTDTYLAQNAPEMEDCALTLREEFPDWQFSYGLLINDKIEVRHRWHKGVHSAYNNAMRAGVPFVTGDTHRLISTPFETRTSRIWGVETGMLADPNGPQFEYTQGQPTRWTSGFAILSFDDMGNMLPPETCEWSQGRAWFRGQAVLRAARISVRPKVTA